eukprot:CAMPEP_0205804606 /NCGR_PEP_ID=MMETSP0205-20121125/7572_1 /ASSEMBLY_ACC=CAM_ASM_000278 /TAXON_ID=36767 /ORGANISM="Euplotes focardii, Strain TN1" /LENGTH=111 /DNA_ID=CAMNT_0053074477 /DNA_START=144 /DNA_END=476 /DNA_ORIENTATION=+
MNDITKNRKKNKIHSPRNANFNKILSRLKKTPVVEDTVYDSKINMFNPQSADNDSIENIRFKTVPIEKKDCPPNQNFHNLWSMSSSELEIQDVGRKIKMKNKFTETKIKKA